MKIRSINSHRGMTFVEVLITVALIGIIVIAGFGFNFFVDSYRLARDTFLYIYVYGDMQRKGMLGLEDMVRGREGHKGIQEAQDITIPATVGAFGETIEFVDGEEDPTAEGYPTTTRQFRKSSAKLQYVNASGGVTDIIDQDVNALKFTKVQDDLVKIELELSKTALGKSITVDLKTYVKLRNKK